MLLEVCVDSVESAVNAEKGGKIRLSQYAAYHYQWSSVYDYGGLDGG